MPRVITAAGSTIGAEAAAAIADTGGNAVDCALAAMLVSMCTEPGIIAPGAGAYLTIGAPGAAPVTIDAYCEMPGRRDPGRLGSNRHEIYMTYGGGMRTNVGYSSVATPGAFAGFEVASRDYGRLPWKALFEPVIEATRAGFPVPSVSAAYLEHSHQEIFGWHPESYEVVHHADGTVRQAGEIIQLPALADTLEQIAAEGAETVYRGDLAERIGREVWDNGGILSTDDLAAYQAIVRTPTQVEVAGWTVHTNPPPAVGGAAVGALLLLVDDGGFDGWTTPELSRLVDIERAVFNYRRQQLEPATDKAAAAKRLLDLAGMGDLAPLLASPSTTHVSAADTDGLACAITASAGYGSGAMIKGTSMWLNNSLGELELHPDGFHGLAPGTRLFSNMAPTVARNPDGEVVAIGSAGADRITTAIGCSLINHLFLEMELPTAIAHPRVHAEIFDGEPTVAYERDLPVETEMRTRHFEGINMYFGGVQAAAWSPAGGLVASADPRRSGDVRAGGKA